MNFQIFIMKYILLFKQEMEMFRASDENRISFTKCLFVTKELKMNFE